MNLPANKEEFHLLFMNGQMVLVSERCTTCTSDWVWVMVTLSQQTGICSNNLRWLSYCYTMLLTANSVGLHCPLVSDLTWEMWRPRLRWTLQHSSQIRTPRLMEAHVGSTKLKSDSYIYIMKWHCHLQEAEHSSHWGFFFGDEWGRCRWGRMLVGLF